MLPPISKPDGRGGRSENEHNNTLKTKGYDLERNFGHGKNNLSNLLLSLNLLAFLFDTMLELYDRRYPGEIDSPMT